MLDQTKPHLHTSDVLAAIREELKTFLESYQNESAAFSSFERYSGLNRKTLRGFLENNRTPYPSTLIRFYQWIFKTDDQAEVTRKLTPEVRAYLVSNGYNIDVTKKNITSLICKSTLHYELYLMTEDHQMVQRQEIAELFGRKGLEALQDLLLAEVLMAVSDETFTAGPIRSNETNSYYNQANELISEMFPWDLVNADPLTREASLSLGNIVVGKKDQLNLERAFQDFKKRLCDLHNKGLKEAPENRLRYTYSAAIFRSALERGQA